MKLFLTPGSLLTGVLFIMSCHGSGKGTLSGYKDDAVYLQSRQILDSSAVLLSNLSVLAESGDKQNEFEALKARNAFQITQQNAEDLRRLLDSLDTNSGNIKDWHGYRLQLQAQGGYLTALMRSGTAILKRNSQSFGNWVDKPKELPDSVLTPVGKAKE